MKRLLLTLCFILTVFFGLIPTSYSIAQTIQIKEQPIIAMFGIGEKTITPEDEEILYEKLKNKFFPAVEKILTPEQRNLFRQALEEKGNIRKAFKTVPLTPEQKMQLSQTIKAMPKEEFLATLTPAQRKHLFLKKKELFKPTLEEIKDKISEEKQELAKIFLGTEKETK
ncbi:hypothetical protein C7H19_07900 [Aphanothece hegewaldii CCALA 016]|uniref:Uncharacterized protein n=1 Tax=Aphanothece hegewaldii CCALA 016 TaxID=2107694 RepID=A0A2T1LZR4_9CHRO|nr:hypothetical protein [Aphanothece hegewaldii]PSF37892.1 hypothetical protein C7H19_07900 [Aphanothece hegewaldii CCALA 016]